MKNTTTQNTKDGKNQVFYSRGEEWFNIISHIAGAGLAIVMSALCIVFCSINAYRGKYTYPALAVTSVSLYGVMIMLMFTMSALYHSRKFGGTARAVFRRFDHCSVALLIAGTYAPFTLIGLVEYGTMQPHDMVWGIVIASLVLACAVLTVVFNAIDVHKFRYFGLAAYVVMGWAALMRIYHIYLAIGLPAFLFLILGGVVYTLGILFYSVKKIKFNHAIWHLFVILGSILHFISIFFFLI